jgi:hypothetical protein
MPLASPETDQETRLAITEQADRELAAEILLAYQAADAYASNARSNVKAAVQEALRCGMMLNAKKATLAHGFWMVWLELYLPEICRGTAERWMKLARMASSHPELENANSLRQAYIAVGILPDPAEQKRKRHEKPAGRRSGLRPAKDFVFLLHQLYAEKCVESVLSVGDFSGWERLELELLEQELTPLATLRERIRVALGRPW